MKKEIREKLADFGLKIDFWYEKGKLDAICVAKWEGEDLILKKEYHIDEISALVLSDFLTEQKDF